MPFHVQEVEVDASGKTLAVIGIRSATPAIHIVVGHLESEIDDLEWIVSRMKAELTEHMSLASGL
jgi:FANCI solenoid 4